MTTIVANGYQLLADTRVSMLDSDSSNLDDQGRIRAFVSDHLLKIAKTNIKIPKSHTDGVDVGKVVAVGVAGEHDFAELIRGATDKEKHPETDLKEIATLCRACWAGNKHPMHILGVTDSKHTVRIEYEEKLTVTTFKPGSVIGIGSGWCKLDDLHCLLKLKVADELQDSFYLATLLDRMSSFAHYAYDSETDSISTMIIPDSKIVERSTRRAMRALMQNFKYTKLDTYVNT